MGDNNYFEWIQFSLSPLKIFASIKYQVVTFVSLQLDTMNSFVMWA